MATQGIIIGTKYFRYEADQDEPEIIRVRSFNEATKEVKYFDKEGNKQKMTLEDLKSKFKMLKPDGMLNVSIVKVGIGSDVITSLVSYDDRSAELPFAVCRQCIYDIFTNMTSRMNNTILGLSINRDSCPSNVKFEQIFMCEGLKEAATIMVYLDDQLTDILKFLNVKKYDAVLRTTAEQIRANYMTAPNSGLCETYKDLLEINHFMYDFRKCFGIVELPYPIEGKDEYGDLDHLTFNNVVFLEDMIKQNIMASYVVKYTREIDLRTIKREYILATSAAENHQNVYIVGYDTSDNEYVPQVQLQPEVQAE